MTYLAEHELLKKAFAVKEHFPSQFAARDSANGNLTPTNVPTYKWALTAGVGYRSGSSARIATDLEWASSPLTHAFHSGKINPSTDMAASAVSQAVPKI